MKHKYLVFVKEGDPLTEGLQFWEGDCEPSLDEILKVYLETGRIKARKLLSLVQDEEQYDVPASDLGYTKVAIWEQLGRYRYRPQEIGGNIVENYD